MSKVKGVFIVILLAFVFVPALSAGFANSPTETASVENETVAVSTSSWNSVDPSHPLVSAYDNETVWYNGSTVSESEYKWNTSTGSIKAVQGGTLDGADNVDITYSYDYHDRWWHLGERVFLIIGTVFGGLLLFVAAGFVLAGVDQMQGSGGGGR